MASRQSQANARNAALMRLCKASRDAIAAAISDADKRAEFMNLTGVKPGPKPSTK